MGFWTYYSPTLLGVVVVLLLQDAIRGRVPTWSAGSQWGLITALALAAAVAAQLAMVGVQGAFAQVLPVPGGRSIRGGAASWGGTLLLGALAAGGALLFFVEAGWALWTTAAAVATAAAGAGFLLLYAWNWPIAQPDFR